MLKSEPVSETLFVPASFYASAREDAAGVVLSAGMTRKPFIDVLIPTCNRASSLAVTLASLAAQTWRRFRIIVSDQSDHSIEESGGELGAVLRYLRHQRFDVRVTRNMPRRGMAQQRNFLFGLSRAEYLLYLDDDLLLEPLSLARMVSAVTRYNCGFVGMAPIGLSFKEDIRPDEQQIEFWKGPIVPEKIVPDSKEWQRYRLHNAANVLHVQQRLELGPNEMIPYKVAWVGGCVLYDREKLSAAGSFDFWRELPKEHCGEDVLAQLRVMARFGGCGLLPSGVYHQETPTTVIERRINAPRVLESSF